MGPGEEDVNAEQNYLWQMGSSDLNCSGSLHHIWTPRLWDILGVLRNIFPAPWEIPRQGYGAQLRDRFVHDEISWILAFKDVIRGQMDAQEAQSLVLTHNGERQ